jgi:type IV pilus assembly protein PilN
MIRINLLPFRIARKKENIRRQISIFFLLILLTAVLLFWYTGVISKQIVDVQDKTKQVNQQILKYKEKAERVAKIKKDLKALKDKLKIVASLEKQREKQLNLFDSITELIVPEGMGLESFKTDKLKVVIKGVAFDNPTVAEFMEKLQRSFLFDKVDLKTSKMKTFQDDIRLKAFELHCRKAIPIIDSTEISK